MIGFDPFSALYSMPRPASVTIQYITCYSYRGKEGKKKKKKRLCVITYRYRKTWASSEMMP